ncbi:MAG: hypothetical protein Ct9H300mP29_4530 [Candidatus Neomarinimicrobiota bacterium]|nr:MAG: hypothetical protein Ct9H300mP29_4530 [Candidatus Neomarinimicrobiota bacterium]
MIVFLFILALNMAEDSKYSNILPSLIAGLVNGIIFVVSAMALGSLIFPGELPKLFTAGNWNSPIRIIDFCAFFSF